MDGSKFMGLPVAVCFSPNMMPAVLIDAVLIKKRVVRNVLRERLSENTMALRSGQFNDLMSALRNQYHLNCRPIRRHGGDDRTFTTSGSRQRGATTKNEQHGTRNKDETP